MLKVAFAHFVDLSGCDLLICLLLFEFAVDCSGLRFIAYFV